MKYLLDTCIILWTLEGNSKKLNRFLDLIMDPHNEIFVSIASYWEIAIKKRLGRIDTSADLSPVIQESGFCWLNITLSHIDYLEHLPLIHHDPFDRLLIAQSKLENLKILTADHKILQYN